ncbi:NTP transferase domain-containing protein [Nonomuraea sp. NPDC026600]|uniref:NTP transferase domain-containing protein n=1 Tax=Nonomuraea sp. NPDC026600 TaxID=3155363 RepID=UPI0033E476F2
MTIGGEYDAVILAGGQARRLGGLDKPGLSVGARAMIESVVLAASGARTVIVVGPERPLPGAVRAGGLEGRPRIVFAREDPPGSGPVPALRAGLREVTAPRVVLLAGDLPYLRAGHVAELLHASSQAATAEGGGGDVSEDAAVGDVSGGHVGGGDVNGAYESGGHTGGGVVAVDDGGREQWLLSLWPAETLRRALDGYTGRSLRGVFGPLVHARVALPGRPWFDCDTMDDLEEARMNVLNEWTALACQELGVDPARVDRDLILELTKEVAHGVARPAAPLTAYLLGLAEGAGTAPADAVARITALARNWGEATAETLTDS